MSPRDVFLTLGGQEYRLRPDYHPMQEIEHRLDMNFNELLELHIAQRLQIKEVATIFFIAATAAGEAFTSVDAVGNVLFEDKLTNPKIQTSLLEYLLECSYTPEEAKKKREIAEIAMGLAEDPNSDG